MARVEVVSIVDAVTRDLRRRILAGELAPGEALGEVDVAERYEVARPTAKAAIESLVGQRLLTRRAHRTARVVTLTPDDARDIYSTRLVIEAEAVRSLARSGSAPDAARRANATIAELRDAPPRAVVEPDMEFHTALVDALGSERLSGLYASLVSEVVLCMAQVQGAALLETSTIVAEHAAILECITAGDEQGAAELLALHIGRARERLVERLGAADR